MLFANTLIGAMLGMLFWVAAARIYDIAAVGLTSAVVSAAMLIATFSNLGLSAVVVRYLTVAGRHEWRLSIVASAIPSLAALVAAWLLSLLPAGRAITTDPRTPEITATLPLIVLAAATAVMLIQDGIFVARGQTRFVLIRGVASLVIRFVLLVPAAQFGAAGLAGACAAGVLAAVGIGAIAWRRPPSSRGESAVSLKQIAAYSGVSYASGLFSQAPQLLYPILVAVYVSHAAAGAFAFAWMATALLMALPPSVANILLAELVHQPDQAARRVRAVTGAVALVVAALSILLGIAIFVFAPIVLPEAAHEVRAFLPILLGSMVPYAIVRMQSMLLALRESLRALLVLNGAVAVAAVGLPLHLLPKFGVPGLEAGWLFSQMIGILIAVLIQRHRGRQVRHG